MAEQDPMESLHFISHTDMTPEQQKEYVAYLYTKTPDEINAIIARKEAFNEDLKKQKAEKQKYLKKLKAKAKKYRLKRLVAEQQHKFGLMMLNDFKTLTSNIEMELKDLDKVSGELKGSFKSYETNYEGAKELLAEKYAEINEFKQELAVKEATYKEKTDALNTEKENRKQSYETTLQKHTEKYQVYNDLKKTRIEKQKVLEKYGMPELLKKMESLQAQKLQITTNIKEKEAKVEDGRKIQRGLKVEIADATAKLETSKITLEQNLVRDRTDEKEVENANMLFVNACKAKLRDEATLIDDSNMALVQELREVMQIHEALNQTKNEQAERLSLDTLIAEKNEVLARCEILKKQEMDLNPKNRVVSNKQREINEANAEMEAINKELNDLEALHDAKIMELGWDEEMMTHMLKMFEEKEKAATPDNSRPEQPNSSSEASGDFALNSSLETSFNLASVSVQALLKKAEQLSSKNSKSMEKSHSETVVVVIDQQKIQENMVDVATGTETDGRVLEMVYEMTAGSAADNSNSAIESVSNSSIPGDILDLFNYVAEKKDNEEEKIATVAAAAAVVAKEKKVKKRRRSTKPKQ